MLFYTISIQTVRNVQTVWVFVTGYLPIATLLSLSPTVRHVGLFSNHLMHSCPFLFSVLQLGWFLSHMASDILFLGKQVTFFSCINATLYLQISGGTWHEAKYTFKQVVLIEGGKNNDLLSSHLLDAYFTYKDIYTVYKSIH